MPAVVVSIDQRDFIWVQPGLTEPPVNATNKAVSQIWIELKTDPIK
jgi:hypothetical protein